jgi:hypothetical protein
VQISTSEVSAAFRELINGTRSREEVASWASRIRDADDTEGLQYVPPSAEVVLWDALEFLIGVDLKDGPDSYLHNLQDIAEYWSSRRGDGL